jgi:hypothetical protein
MDSGFIRGSALYWLQDENLSNRLPAYKRPEEDQEDIMDITIARPTNEGVQLTASALQETRFKERKQREAQSVARNDAIFFSPVIKVDTETNTAIIQYRDVQTGEVQNQYPSPKQIDSYKQAQQLEVPEEPIIVDGPAVAVSSAAGDSAEPEDS